MRDILDDIFKNQPLDPTEAARRNMRPQLRARFYNEASVEQRDGGFAVVLDGRPVRTPARNPLAVPVRGLADALAAEWQAQTDKIDPAAMPLTRLANSVIDGVVSAPTPVADEIKKYLGTDLLFYRADSPPGLVESQCQHWDPVLDWARDALGARFVLSEGIVHVEQPEAAMAAAARVIPDGRHSQGAWQLGALNAVTTLTGSALLALALASGLLDAYQAWAAAHVDEDWNMSFWGRDELAMQRRAYRFAEMQAAATVLSQLR